MRLSLVMFDHIHIDKQAMKAEAVFLVNRLGSEAA